MTENVFYPLFLTVALALVLVARAADACGGRLILLALVGARVRDARAGGRARPGVAVGAAPARALRADGRCARRLRPFRPLYGVVVGRRGCSCSPARPRAAARRGPARRVLASSATATTTRGQVARFLLYHLAELDLYLGVLPFAALFVLLGARPPARARRSRAFARRGVALVVSLAARRRGVRLACSRTGSRSGTCSSSRRSS